MRSAIARSSGVGVKGRTWGIWRWSGGVVEEERENGRELGLVWTSRGSGGGSGGEYVGEEGRGGVWRGAKGKENSESNKGEGKSICKSQCFSGFENGEEGLEVWFEGATYGNVLSGISHDMRVKLKG